jgi:outer membrane protein TolC
LPSRIWTIGPDLAGTIFDGGARTAAQNVLTQRLTLLMAKQSVDDTFGQVAQSQVGLIRNLGGGWQSGT